MRRKALSGMVREVESELRESAGFESRSRRDWAETRIRWWDASRRRALARAAEYLAAAEIADADADWRSDSDAAADRAAEAVKGAEAWAAWADRATAASQVVIDLLNEWIGAYDRDEADIARGVSVQVQHADQAAGQVLAREKSLPAAPSVAYMRPPGELVVSAIAGKPTSLRLPTARQIRKWGRDRGHSIARYYE